MRNLFILSIILLIASQHIYSFTNQQNKDLRTLVSLLNYISKDYKMAVDNGKIINNDEFNEMDDFTNKCTILQKELIPIVNNNAFTKLQDSLTKLRASVLNKDTYENVSKAASIIKNNIIDLNILKISPSRYPSLKRGALLFKNNCASCHGDNGKGDGVMSKDLEPKPTDFHNAEVMDLLSPMQAYNIIKLGVAGTSMRSFEELNDNDIWSLAFYILSLRHNHNNKSIDKLSTNISLDSLSKWNDKELNEFLQKSNTNITLSNIRNYEPSQADPLDIAIKELNLSYQLFNKGDYSQAEKHALTSYLEGIELVENVLNASKPELVRSIEKDMIAYRKALLKGDKDNVDHLYLQLTERIENAKSILSELEYSFAFIYGASLSILLRESLESLLIILIILSILKPLNMQKAILAVHIGWIFAIILGFLGWIFVDKLINISGASRELMEGIGSIIAVIVLLYAGTWLHSHSEVFKWTDFIKTKISSISDSGSVVGLGIFAFIVVFREAVEVVLFLSSLTLNNPNQSDSALIWAVVTTTILIAIISIIFSKYTKKLPIGKIFKISAYVIAVLAVILTGKGIAALQEAGYIPIMLINHIPRIDLLGFYPNIQSILAQFIILAIIIYITKRTKKDQSH